MKLPLSWLASVVDLPDMPVSELAEVMGRHGLEVDGIATPGADVVDVTTARVRSWQPHPNADKLRVVQITHGDDQVELVCGAWNFDVGDVVVHAPVGGAIPGMVMEARTLRGVVSNGMLCSARELQVGEEHDGIMVLDADTPLGRDIHEIMPLGEPVLDLEVKGIRGDVLSVVGAGRDVAAILDVELTLPDPVAITPPDVADTTAVGVTIDTPQACSHFVALTLDDVQVPSSSPWWMRQRLAQVGVRSISPLVDITNYVMMELGQPMHAYDADCLDGDLQIRWARVDEELTTLDDVARTLTTRDLVVADAAGAVGLAGVMGGESTEVTATTTRLVLEAAVWDPGTVRHTARSLRLTSEASLRFERGVDPAGAHRAIARAWELLQQVGGCGRVVGVTEDGHARPTREPVVASVSRINGLLGLDLTADEMVVLLARAQVAGVSDGAELTVTPPSWRSDLNRMVDIAEEVARLHGYDHIPAALPPLVQRGGLTADQQAERDIRRTVLAFGPDEVITRPFVGQDHVSGVVAGDDRVVLANPLAQDAAAMRPTLFEGLLGVVRRNVGQSRPGVAVFEMGRIFRPAGGPMDEVLDTLAPASGPQWRWTLPDESLLPTQPKAIGIALQGRRQAPGRLDAQTWTVADALSVFDEVVRRHGPSRSVLQRVPVQRQGLHPYRTVALQLDGVEVGLVGQLHPSEASARDLPEPVVVGELIIQPWLQALMAGRPVVEGPTLVTRPAMIVDVAVESSETLAWSVVAAAIESAAGALLADMKVFDVYRGEPLPDGHRSVAARLWLQSPERALTSEDEAAVLVAVETAVAEVGARLRR